MTGRGQSASPAAGRDPARVPAATGRAPARESAPEPDPLHLMTLVRLNRATDIYLGGFVLLSAAIVAIEGLDGGPWLPDLPILLGFVVTNVAVNRLLLRAPTPRAKILVETTRVLADGLIVLALCAFGRSCVAPWWAGFLLIPLGAAMMASLLALRSHLGQWLASYCIALYALSMVLRPGPVDWHDTVIKAGTIAMVALMCSEMFSLLARTLARETGQRRDLEATMEQLGSTQRQLVQAGKMAAIGQLAGGVAHEINNPLGVILGFAQGMERRLDEQHPLSLPVRSIVREALRSKALVQELLTFSRTARRTSEPVDVNQAAQAASVLLESRGKTLGLKLHMELDAEAGQVEANTTQLQQILVNLGNNGMDAMQPGGLLTIRTRRERGQVLIEVCDTGDGISEPDRDRIFDPFFTTKEPGKGTGLGLSLVYEIVKQHGGDIQVESELGRGSTMSVRLPASRLAAAEAAAP